MSRLIALACLLLAAGCGKHGIDELQGTWVKSCEAAPSGGNSNRYTLAVTNESAALTVETFSGTSCATSVASVTKEFTVSVGKDSLAALGAVEVDFTLKSDGSKTYNLFKVDEEAGLYLGAVPGDADHSTEATRPASLESKAYSKQ
jgi:hypothetical protein